MAQMTIAVAAAPNALELVAHLPADHPIRADVETIHAEIYSERRLP